MGFPILSKGNAIGKIDRFLESFRTSLINNLRQSMITWFFELFCLSILLLFIKSPVFPSLYVEKVTTQS